MTDDEIQYVNQGALHALTDVELERVIAEGGPAAMIEIACRIRDARKAKADRADRNARLNAAQSGTWGDA